MLPSSGDCDDCVPDYIQRRVSSTAFSLLPFLLTFLIVAAAVRQKLFPLFSGRPPGKEHEQQLPSHSFSIGGVSARGRLKQFTARHLAGTVFATNIALSAVLVELILCEISNSGLPAARSLALNITLPSLLLLLILATPALELHSVISSAGWKFAGAGKGTRWTAWGLEMFGLLVWVLGFWYLGSGLLGSYLHEASYVREHSFSEGCLERIGVIGISLMASLAGFAAVSSLWDTFGAKAKLVTDSDVSRKQAGLNATIEMMQAKQSRLRAIDRKLSETPAEGFMTKVIGTIRGNADVQERKALQLEISGLETMRLALSNSLMSLQNRRQAQQRASTPQGKLLNLTSYLFSLYCLYRIGATTLTTLRRVSAPNTTFSNSDPINNFLALLAKHWDPAMDRAAWSRQISFFLSFVMLLASFNSVLQTFLLFARLFPNLMRHAQQNLALLVSQISATYVISSALLLRSSLPPEVRSVISDALGAPLEPGFVDRWFEGWFLAASAFTAAGIWIGRKVRSSGWDDDDELGDGDVEMGKMN